MLPEYQRTRASLSELLVHSHEVRAQVRVFACVCVCVCVCALQPMYVGSVMSGSIGPSSHNSHMMGAPMGSPAQGYPQQYGQV